MKIMHNRRGSKRHRFYGEMMETEEFVESMKKEMSLRFPVDPKVRKRRRVKRE